MIDGASGSENRFIVDGMDTTALQTGVSNKEVLTDFLAEVQVKSSGYNAGTRRDRWRHLGDHQEQQQPLPR